MEKQLKISVYWAKIQKNFLTQGLNLVTVGSPEIWNGSSEYCWRYRADTILSTNRRTDGRTNRDRQTDWRTDGHTDRQTDRQTGRQTDRRTDGQGETSIPPFQLCWSGRYKNLPVQLDRIASSVNCNQNNLNPSLPLVHLPYHCIHIHLTLNSLWL